MLSWALRPRRLPYRKRSSLLPVGELSFYQVPHQAVPPGIYKVYVTEARIPVSMEDAGKPGAPDGKPLIHERFAAYEHSPLEVQIGQTTTFDLTVEKP